MATIYIPSTYIMILYILLGIIEKKNNKKPKKLRHIYIYNDNKPQHRNKRTYNNKQQQTNIQTKAKESKWEKPQSDQPSLAQMLSSLSVLPPTSVESGSCMP